MILNYSNTNRNIIHQHQYKCWVSTANRPGPWWKDARKEMFEIKVLRARKTSKHSKTCNEREARMKEEAALI